MTRLTRSHFARDLEILQHNVIDGVRNVGGSTRPNSDHHDLSYEKSTQLVGSHFARDLEILQRIEHGMRNVGGSTRSESDRHNPSYKKSTRLTGNHFARDLGKYSVSWPM